MRTRSASRRLLSLVGAIILAACASFVPRPGPEVAQAAQDGETTAFLGLINNYRAQNGLAQFGVDNSLNGAASYMSDDMLAHCVAQGNCQHTDSTGRNFDQRLRDYGYPAGTSQGAGENINWGSGGADTTAQQAFDIWRNSPAHNANMLNSSFRAIGISRSCNGGTCAWVTDFGTAVVNGAGSGSGGMTGRTATLQLWYNYNRFDNFSTATTAGYADAQQAGYFLIRNEANVFTSQQPGTVPLQLWYSYDRHDNFTTATAAGANDARLAGYFLIRTEGYIYPSQQPGTVPLKLYYSYNRHDNMLVASAAGEQSAQQAGYFLIRIEGYALP